MKIDLEAEIEFDFENATSEEFGAYLEAEFAKQDREFAQPNNTSGQSTEKQKISADIAPLIQPVAASREALQPFKAKSVVNCTASSTSPIEVEDLYLEPYSFPREAFEESHYAEEFASLTTMGLAEILGDLSYERSNGKLRPYGEVREKICAISIELNRRGKLAPRFRDVRRPPRTPRTIDDVNLSRDRQVFDIHWLYASGQREHAKRGQHKFHQNVHFKKEFTIDFAEAFAQTPISTHEKATWLCLPDHIAFQLAAIQTNAIREKYRVVTTGDNRGSLSLDTVIRCLENSVANQPHMASHVHTWTTIWLSARLVGEKAEVLRTFHAYTEGRESPLDRRDIIRRLETINLRLERELPSLRTAA